jgi:hypothetical protein
MLKSRINTTEAKKTNSDGSVIGKLIKNVASSYTGQPTQDQIEFFMNILERVDFNYLIKETAETEL